MAFKLLNKTTIIHSKGFVIDTKNDILRYPSKSTLKIDKKITIDSKKINFSVCMLETFRYRTYMSYKAKYIKYLDNNPYNNDITNLEYDETYIQSYNYNIRNKPDFILILKEYNDSYKLLNEYSSAENIKHLIKPFSKISFYMELLRNKNAYINKKFWELEIKTIYNNKHTYIYPIIPNTSYYLSDDLYYVIDKYRNQVLTIYQKKDNNNNILHYVLLCLNNEIKQYYLEYYNINLQLYINNIVKNVPSIFNNDLIDI
jgi:hypothetical protein